MSSGSYFEIYRKYKTKATDEVYKSLQKQYVEEYKSNGMSSKKTDEEYLKMLPKVLDVNYGKKESVYDEASQTWKDVRDCSIEGRRLNFLSVLRDDKSYLDKLLSYSFCSSFTSLKSEWNLDPYVDDRSQKIVDKLTAQRILQACNYLLSGKWSDDFEKILDNEWISTLASGNSSDNYWKYIYRNDKKTLKDFSDEEMNSAEFDLRRLKKVLDAFTSIEDDYENEYILVYTAW